MKNYIKIISKYSLIIGLLILSGSCNDYLEKSPDSDIMDIGQIHGIGEKMKFNLQPVIFTLYVKLIKEIFGAGNLNMMVGKQDG
jgi:hypothetical protein